MTGMHDGAQTSLSDKKYLPCNHRLPTYGWLQCPTLVNDFDKCEVASRMGGSGSGRRWSRTKRTTNEYLQVDVRHWQRDGLLREGVRFNLEWTDSCVVTKTLSVSVRLDSLIFEGRFVESGYWLGADYVVPLARTSCHYGGRRTWFCCPEPSCRRRVAVLYGHRGIFVCRRCYQLAYKSQRRQRRDRALHRAQAIRTKLGASGDVTQPFPEKPGRMHWRTYERLRQQESDARARAGTPSAI